MWQADLPEIDRRTLVFIRVYEKARQQRGQFGYRAFREHCQENVNTPFFKQCRTVVTWLDAGGWTISWTEIAWRGYVEYVFREMKRVPLPGQLKNKMMLSHYVKSAPVKVAYYERTDAEMEAIYAKAIRPELRDKVGLRALYGARIVPDDRAATKSGS